jgi:3,4-dihydroxy 2-butanone 4-phosphate synthase/GTP cyclohydrolase II
MDLIAQEGRGVVVLIREPRSTSLSERLRARMEEGPKGGQRLVDYGVGAQILADMGVTDMVLLSNTPKNIIALDGYGLKVVAQRPLTDEE